MSVGKAERDRRDEWLSRCLQRGITEDQIVTWLAEVRDEEPTEMVEQLRDKEPVAPDEWMDYVEEFNESKKRWPDKSSLLHLMEAMARTWWGTHESLVSDLLEQFWAGPGNKRWYRALKRRAQQWLEDDDQAN